MTNRKGKTTTHYLARQLLTKLGISQPNNQQIILIEKLLIGITINHLIVLHQHLTEREKSCLLLAARGYTMAETADLLNVKFSTIDTWHKSIKRKLDCRTITQAVFEGIRYGYISPPVNK